MTITSIKDLSKLIDLCRKKGIKSISVDGVAIELGHDPKPKRRNEPDISPVPQYSDDDVLAWSTHNFEGAG